MKPREDYEPLFFRGPAFLISDAGDAFMIVANRGQESIHLR